MKTTAWLQVEPTWTLRGDRLHHLTVARVTQRRPAAPIPGSALVRIELEIPDSVFQPLDAKLVVEESDLEVVPRTLRPIEETA